jgi:serine/threonine-protein kinase ULK/ATG1
MFFRGSFAVVRVGTSTKTHLKCAIKELFTLEFTKDQIEDLSKEINILSQLHHQNIVRLYEVFKTAIHTYLV